MRLGKINKVMCATLIFAFVFFSVMSNLNIKTALADTTTLIDENFDSYQSPPYKGWEFSPGVERHQKHWWSSDFALKLDTTGESVTTPTLSNPNYLEFNILPNSNDNKSSLKIEEFNGTSWNELAVIYPNKNQTLKYDLANNTTKVKFTYIENKNKSWAELDDVKITGTPSVPSTNSGSRVTIDVTDSSNQIIPQYLNAGGTLLNKILTPEVRLAPNATAKVSYDFPSQGVTMHKYKFVTAASIADIPAFPADSAMIDLNMPEPNTKESFGGDVGTQGYVSVKHYNYAGKSSPTGLSRDVSFGSPIGNDMLVQKAVPANDISEGTANAFLNNVTAYNPDKYAKLKAMKVWGYFSPTVSGNYVLGAYSDDGAYGYVMVNGQKKVFVENWEIKAAYDRSNGTAIALEAGKYYPIYMEWYEGCATQAAFIPRYKLNNSTSFTNIPSSMFFSSNTTTPGESAGAYFGDVSGINFPAQDGVYYLATKFVSTNGNPSGLYGPFVIDNTKPVIKDLTVTSNNAGGNKIAANGNTLSINFTASEVLTTNPQVTINGLTPTATLTKDATNHYTMTVQINSDGTINANKLNSNGTMGTANQSIDNGLLNVQVANYSDMSGNEGNIVSDNTITYDSIPPTVALTYSANPASAGTQIITATYSEPVSTLDTPKVSVVQQYGTAKIDSATMSGSSDRKTWTYNYIVNVDNGGTYKDGSSTVTLSATHDQAGNTSASPTNNTFNVKTKAMLATLTFSADPVKAGIEKIKATYSKAVKASETPKIVVKQLGTATMTAASMTSVSDDRTVWTYDYTVNADNGGSFKDGPATVTLSSVTDTWNNTVPQPLVNTFLIDTKSPTVALSYTTNNAKAGVNKITATYSEPVKNGVTPQISVTQQGTEKINLATMSGSTDRKIWTYDYIVHAANGGSYKDGIATVSLSAVSDVAGNNATAPSGTTFNIDTTPPTFTISDPSVTVTKGGPVTYTVTYSNNDTLVLNSKYSGYVSLIKTNTADGEITASIIGNVGTITIKNITGDGTLTVAIAAGTANDSAGNNALALTGPKTFIVDNTALVPVISSPVSGAKLTDNTPTITGTAEANATVKVYDGDKLMGTVPADGSGNWTFTPITALADGTHSLTATATDGVGNVSTASIPVSITIDTFPAVPVITSPKSGTLTNDNTPAITGTAEANVIVKLYDGSTLIGTVTADGSGNWTLTPSVALTDGIHSLTATATNGAGTASPVSTAVSITIDTVPPAVGTPDLAADSDTGVSNTDNITSITKPTLTGTAEANSIVTLYDGATAIGTSTADSTGNWSITPTTDLAQGSHNLTAKASDTAGNMSAASTPLTVTIRAFDVNIYKSGSDTTNVNVKVIQGGLAYATVEFKIDSPVSSLNMDIVTQKSEDNSWKPSSDITLKGMKFIQQLSNGQNNKLSTPYIETGKIGYSFGDGALLKKGTYKFDIELNIPKNVVLDTQYRVLINAVSFKVGGEQFGWENDTDKAQAILNITIQKKPRIS